MQEGWQEKRGGKRRKEMRRRGWKEEQRQKDREREKKKGKSVTERRGGK